MLAAYPDFKQEDLTDDEENQRLLLRTSGAKGTRLAGLYSYEQVSEHQQGRPLIGENQTVAQLIIQFSPIDGLRAPGTLYRFEEVEEAARSGVFAQKIVLAGRKVPTDMFPVARGLVSEKRYGIELHADFLNTLRNQFPSLQVSAQTSAQQVRQNASGNDRGAEGDTNLGRKSRAACSKDRVDDGPDVRHRCHHRRCDCDHCRFAERERRYR